MANLYSGSILRAGQEETDEIRIAILSIRLILGSEELLGGGLIFCTLEKVLVVGRQAGSGQSGRSNSPNSPQRPEPHTTSKELRSCRTVH